MMDILCTTINHDIGIERAKLRRHLVDKFAPRIKNGEFGDFGNLWARIEGGISNINQLVDDVTDNISRPWGSKLFAAIFSDIIEFYRLKDALDRIGGCITLPLLQLAVSCVSASVPAQWLTSDILSRRPTSCCVSLTIKLPTEQSCHKSTPQHIRLPTRFNSR
jgi:hypothetical protein